MRLRSAWGEGIISGWRATRLICVQTNIIGASRRWEGQVRCYHQNFGASASWLRTQDKIPSSSYIPSSQRLVVVYH